MNETVLSYRRQAESDDIYCPFQKNVLSKAAVKVGGEGNDTTYFLQDDGRTKKQKCVSFPFSVFTPTIKEKLVEGKDLIVWLYTTLLSDWLINGQ